MAEGYSGYNENVLIYPLRGVYNETGDYYFILNYRNHNADIWGRRPGRSKVLQDHKYKQYPYYKCPYQTVGKPWGHSEAHNRIDKISKENSDLRKAGRFEAGKYPLI